jgi:nicotinate-nucleotide pyrophosphorylase (carboxylating)
MTQSTKALPGTSPLSQAPSIPAASAEEIDRVVRLALSEDVGEGDLTSNALFSHKASCHARVIAKAHGVMCGVDIAREVFVTLDPGCAFDAAVADGERLAPEQVVGEIDGPARAVLAGERTALNFLGRLSGIATLTSRYVEAVGGTGAIILDTRKTTPGLRALEKYAVRCGGGSNHRNALDDGILVKDNHLALLDGVGQATRRVLAHAPADVMIEIEVETLDDVQDALAAGATHLLLDNMTPKQLADAVRLVNGRALLEASGGVTLDSVRHVAETGVDSISSGALTHSAVALDFSLEVTS